MKIVTVSCTTLFHVAQQFLGDAAQWQMIAELNGVDDPFIQGLTALAIPHLPAALTTPPARRD
jgi:hypothetical protein